MNRSQLMRLTKKELIDIILSEPEPEPIPEPEPESDQESEPEAEESKNELPSDTPSQIALHIKKISFKEAQKDYEKLCVLPQLERLSLVGNKLNWYYFNELTLYTRVKSNTHNFYEFWKIYKEGNILQLITQKKYDKLLEKIKTKEYDNRVTLCSKFYAFYKNYIGGYIGLFKSNLARTFYIRYKSKSIIDPYAGWGGRLIGASSLGLNYIGFDTNISLRPAYEQMISDLDFQHVKINYQDSSKVDFSKYDYDTVLTSPPYYVEFYDHFDRKNNKDEWFTDVMMLTFKHLWKNLKVGGVMGINVNKKMYDKYLMPEFGVFNESIDIKNSTMKRHMVQDKDKKNSFELLYVWRKI